MNTASQYVLLLISSLGVLGLLGDLWIQRRKEPIPGRTLAAVLPVVAAYGWVFYAAANGLFGPADLYVGMDFDTADLILKQHGTERTGFDILGELQGTLRHYQLASGPTFAVVSRESPNGRIVESLSVSTYVPKSWKGKGDPERDRFLDSFVRVDKYNLNTKPQAGGGARRSDLVGPGGSSGGAAEESEAKLSRSGGHHAVDWVACRGESRIRYLLACVGLLVFALVVCPGAYAGAIATPRAIRWIHGILLIVLGLFALSFVMVRYDLGHPFAFDPSFVFREIGNYVILQEVENPPIFWAAVCVASLMSYLLFAFSASVALFFRAEHRHSGVRMAFTALLAVAIVRLSRVI